MCSSSCVWSRATSFLHRSGQAHVPCVLPCWRNRSIRCGTGVSSMSCSGMEGRNARRMTYLFPISLSWGARDNTLPVLLLVAIACVCSVAACQGCGGDRREGGATKVYLTRWNDLVWWGQLSKKLQYHRECYNKESLKRRSAYRLQTHTPLCIA